MQMTTSNPIKIKFPSALIWFAIGLGLVLLIPILPIFPSIQTFMHTWRPEFLSSVFFVLLFGFGFFYSAKELKVDFYRKEFFLLIIPITCFILWSLTSALWADSTRSVLHHTFNWIFYFLLYLSTRYFLNKENGLENCLLIIAVSICIISIPGVIEYVVFVTFDNGATSLRYSKYSELVNVVFPLLFVFFLKFDGKKFWLGLIPLTAIELLIISSLNRTNSILFIFSLSVLALLAFAFKRFHQFRMKSVLAILTFVIAGIAVHVPAVLFDMEVPMMTRINHATTSISTSIRPFFAAISLEMIKENPVVGVGADNWGLKYDKYRRVYADSNPSDNQLSIAENEVAERAHNEYLQVFSELGAIGFIIFFTFLLGIGYLFWKAILNRKDISLLSIASLIGLFVFLVSSMVTSYSFRLLQNGFIFFFVLAFAVNSLLKNDHKLNLSRISVPTIKFGYAVALLICLFAVGFNFSRVASAYQTLQAANIEDIQVSSPIFQNAIALDSENANAYSVFGVTLLNAGRYEDAKVQFEKAAQLGRTTTTDISMLISSQVLSNDLAGAEKTLQTFTKSYPKSVFYLTRYATILNEQGRKVESEEQLNRAFAVNRKLAKTWFSLQNEGALKTSIKASKDNEMLSVAELRPLHTLYAFLMEREIKFPEEKQKTRY